MAAILLLLAAAVAAPVPAPPPLVRQWEAKAPESLASFEPLKGGFAGASANEKAEWQPIETYAEACQKAAREAVRAELKPLGFEAAALPPGTYRDRTCRPASTLYSLARPAMTWAAFEAALREAWPVYSAYLAAVDNAEGVADEGLHAETAALGAAEARPNLRAALPARIVGEQVLRLGLNSSGGGESLSPGARAILRALFWDAIARRDHANTDWLKAEVERSGWPTNSAVGKAAAGKAWLLVQHADDDPAFQARVLRLMAPLAARGEVSKHDYALLYDRVMLKVAGHQRYGTQFECRGGRFEPRPLEDPARVEQWSKTAGLDTLAENGARINRENSNLCR